MAELLVKLYLIAALMQLGISLKEAQILIERWRIDYNTIRPHSSLGYKPPAPETSTINQRTVDFKYVS